MVIGFPDYWQVDHGYRLHKSAPYLVDKIEEAYLRTDIACGVPFCKECHMKYQHLPSSASHYVIPTARALQEVLEIVELPEFEGCIILTSVLKEVIFSSLGCSLLVPWLAEKQLR